MWRVTILANAILMGLFWLASIISMSMAFNRLVQYVKSEALNAVPLLTDAALSVRLWAGLLPFVWIILSFLAWKIVKNKEPESRSEYLLAFTSITVIAGFSMLIFFALAGILPFLLIGGAIN